MTDPCNPCNPPAHGAVSLGSFFGPGATSLFSAPFEVKDRPLILTAVGLETGTSISIENVFGCGLGEDFSPVLDGCCKPVKLNRCNPQQIVILTGRYRLVLNVDAGVTFLPSDVTVYSRFNNGRLPEGGSSMSCNCDAPVVATLTGPQIADLVCGSAVAKAVMTGCLVPPAAALVTDATLTGAGTVASPLHAVIPPAVALVTDATLTGAGTAASPLHAVIPPAAALVTDATLTGAGTAASPLHAVIPAFAGVSVTGPITGNGLAGTPLALDLNALLNALAALPAWCGKVHLCAPAVAPIAGNDNASTGFNTPHSGTVATNDFAGNGGALSWAVASQPANGVVVMSSNGSYTFTPTAGFTGSTTFTYTLTEVGNGTATGTVTIGVGAQPPGPVDAVNDGPIYARGHVTSAYYNNPAPVQVINALANDTGTSLSITTASVPVAAGTVSHTASTISFTPTNGATGQTTITYSIVGTGGNTDTATIAVLLGTPQFNSFGNIVLGYQYSDGTITDANNTPL